MDQRHHPRFPVHFRSSFSSVNRVGGDGNVVDLSLRGCGILSATAVHPGTTLELRIQPAGDAAALTIQQPVARRCPDGRIRTESASLQPD